MLNKDTYLKFVKIDHVEEIEQQSQRGVLMRDIADDILFISSFLGVSKFD